MKLILEAVGLLGGIGLLVKFGLKALRAKVPVIVDKVVAISEANPQIKAELANPDVKAEIEGIAQDASAELKKDLDSDGPK